MLKLTMQLDQVHVLSIITLEEEPLLHQKKARNSQMQKRNGKQMQQLFTAY